MSDPSPETVVAPPLSARLDDWPRLPGYDVLGLAGRGGMGSVYQARQLGLDRIVAVKVLPAGTDPRIVARFAAEARSAASLKHAHIAAIYDVSGDAAQPYYVMEYARHGTLADRLAGRPQPPRDAAVLIADIADAVQHCHDQGLIHRDLKPANILLADADGQVVPKISDFGLVKRTGADEAKLTKTGEILGTPSYMAPEQASGVCTNVGPAADIYALGTVLYECLTGRPPFVAAEPMQVVLQLLADDPLRPRMLEPAIPRDLETIALKCLEKLPRKRYLRAADLAADLRHWLAGEPIVARPASRTERTWKWARRRPWQAAALAACAALILGSITAAILLNRKARELADVNEGLVKSKAETDRMLEVMLASLDKYYFSLSDNLRDLPRGEKLRREVIEEARATLRKIETIRPNDPTLREFQAHSWLKLGDIELKDDRVEEARDAFDRARELFAALAKAYPGALQYRVNEAKATFRAAQARKQLGTAGTATMFAAAIDAAESLYIEAPNDAGVLNIAAVAASERFQIALIAQSPDMDAHLKHVVDLRRRRAALLADDPAAVAESAAAELVWGELLLAQGKPVEAEATVRAARDRLRAQDGDSIAFRRLHVHASQLLARLAVKRSDFAAAAAAHREIVAMLRRTASDRPGAAAPQRELIQALRELSRSASAAGEVKESRDARDEAERRQKNLPEPQP